MKIQKKISIIVLIITIPSILIINTSFGLFFQNFIHDQEDAAVKKMYATVQSFLSEKEKKYMGSVNDWAHWDDTYAYVNGDDPDYIVNNLMINTFLNLDISFVVFLNENDSVLDKFYYDYEKEQITEFPIGFQEDFEKLVSLPLFGNDTDGIYKIGDEFYIIASTDITDSTEQKKSNKQMYFGRVIDKGILEKMEKFTGCSVLVDTRAMPSESILEEETDEIILLNIAASESKDAIIMEIIVPYAYKDDETVSFALTMKREMFINGMRNIIFFAVMNSIFIIAVSFVIYLFLGKYVSKPFVDLINDVKYLDLDQKKIGKLNQYGSNEFIFLRRAINDMIERIDEGRNEVRINEEKWLATLISVGDGVITVDMNSKVQFMNPIAQQLTGWKEDAYGEQIETVFNIVNEFTKEKIESPIKSVFETNSIAQLDNNTILTSKDGMERAIEDTAAPIRDAAGIVIGCVLVFRDFTEKKERQKRIEYLSFHDQLTGLYNRRFLEEELKRLDTIRNMPISILYGDINGLKTINDAFGHSVGDTYICKVADVLKMECRADDIIARVGGDEFIILLPKTDICTAEILAERIKSKIEMEKSLDSDISISFGWETKNTENQTMQACIKTAEDYMYNKKFFNSSSKKNAVIRSIINALYVKSPREAAHSNRVSILSESMGKAYNLSIDEINMLKVAGELHDIGKIAVDESILNKVGRLTESEFVQVKKHPEIGNRLLGTSAEFYDISELILAHHERWDGTGYPKGLKGEDIQIGARILAIADAFDAMTCERPYRKALNLDEAIVEIKNNAGTQFDPAVVSVFVEKVLLAKW